MRGKPDMRELNVPILAAILASVCFAVSEQLLLRTGRRDAGTMSTGPIGLLWFHLAALRDWRVVSGLACYAISTLLWLWVLSRLGLSLAYPFLGLNLILVIVGAAVLLGEQVTLANIIGGWLIVVGRS